MKRGNSIGRVLAVSVLLALLALSLTLVFQLTPLRPFGAFQGASNATRTAAGVYPAPPGLVDPSFDLTATAEESAQLGLIPPTDLPPATLIPTPRVTPVPVASNPIIPAGDCPRGSQGTILFRQGNALLAVNGDGGRNPVVDVLEEAGLYLANDPVGVNGSNWINVSPDGKRIALVLSSDPDAVSRDNPLESTAIYLFDRESGVLKLLLEEGRDPVWSPDGNLLAYLSGTSLWVMDVESGETENILITDADHEHVIESLAWSPDSRALVVVDGVFRQMNRIKAVDIQTGEIIFEREHPLHFVYSPAWSPEGNRILYLTTDGVASSSKKFINLWAMGSDGSDPIQLTQDIQVLSSPRWSPDGRWVAFAGLIPYEAEEGSADLWLLDPRAADLRRVTSTGVISELSPRWSPNCSFLYYSVGGVATGRVSLEDGSEENIIADSGDFVISP